MNTAIAVKNLRKSYREVDVLRDVTFDIKKGSIFALLGANGAGKTTTINILTTLLRADDGTATVNGYDVAAQPGNVRASISLTGQFAAVDDVLTARENLLLVGDLRHAKNAARVAGTLLEQFDLSDAADRRVATFSGGMRRRLDIAMSLIGEASVIFLDEPTTGLDPQSRTMMWQTIKHLAANGTTVFLTTQYLEEADQLADHIAILHEGRIVAQGNAAKLKELLPGGRIELHFSGKKQLQEAEKLFAGFVETIPQPESLGLSIITDGSAARAAHIFRELDARRIEVTGFSQKMPTLDDVFLEIINRKRKQ